MFRLSVPTCCASVWWPLILYFGEDGPMLQLCTTLLHGVDDQRNMLNDDTTVCDAGYTLHFHNNAVIYMFNTMKYADEASYREIVFQSMMTTLMSRHAAASPTAVKSRITETCITHIQGAPINYETKKIYRLTVIIHSKTVTTYRWLITVSEPTWKMYKQTMAIMHMGNGIIAHIFSASL